jgi:hypothetical protein
MQTEGIEYTYVRASQRMMGETNLNEINAMLKNGWVPVRECPFGHGTCNYASVLILMSRKFKVADVVVTEVGNELDS